MDNKITKRRFADFLSYEWLFIIIICVVAIIGWNLIYTVAAPRLSVGQSFKLIYDDGVSTNYMHNVIQISQRANERDYLGQPHGAFSYDVLKIETEGMSNSIDNELGIRYDTKDADVLVTFSQDMQNAQGLTFRKVNGIIESYNVWSFNKAIKDGDLYLENLLKTGVVKHEAGDINNSYTMDQIDTEKVKNLFLSRQEGDNRYRKEADKQQGIIYEIQRIETLCYEIDFTKRLFRDHKEVFYYYAIGEQSYNQAVEHAKDQALIQSKQQVFEQNKQKNLINYGVEKLAYGIDFDKLTDSYEFKVGDFFTDDYGESKNLVMLAFDFIGSQPHLQYESLSFINTVIRLCSDIV
jgi:hypothetical protein